jgi:predicted DNA-binding transcriptional regulator AlpA
MLRIRDVGAYLGVSHQRADQMFHEGKFPEAERVDGIGPMWKPATIERWAERERWANAALEEQAED